MSHLNLIFLIALISLYGCSDYQSGYRAGYEGSDQKQWIVFGRSDYHDGFHAGQAEKFQDDWLLENPIEESLMQCPSVVVRADPLIFLPAGYKDLGQSVYSRID